MGKRVEGELNGRWMVVEHREIEKYRECVYCEGGLINHAWESKSHPGSIVISLVLDRRGNQFQHLVFIN